MSILSFSSNYQSVFQSLDNYNSINFQETLLLAINDSLGQITQSDSRFNIKVFLENIRKDNETKKNTIEVQLEEWKNNSMSLKDLNDLKSFFEVNHLWKSLLHSRPFHV